GKVADQVLAHAVEIDVVGGDDRVADVGGAAELEEDTASDVRAVAGNRGVEKGDDRRMEAAADAAGDIAGDGTACKCGHGAEDAAASAAGVVVADGAVGQGDAPGVDAAGIAGGGVVADRAVEEGRRTGADAGTVGGAVAADGAGDQQQFVIDVDAAI